MEGDTSGSSEGAADSTQDEAVTTATRNEQDHNPFEEYMWMGDPKEEDEVNLQVLEEILEEEFIESCFEEMLEEEALGLFSPPGETPGDGPGDLVPSLHSLSLEGDGSAEVAIEGVAADEPASDGSRDRLAPTGGGDVVAPPSGFGGHSSDGESENSDSDSLGDTPQR